MSKRIPIQITERAVVAGALLAMNEDRLMAQVAQHTPALLRRGCTYDNAVYGCRCLVGAGLSDSDIAKLKGWRANNKSVSALVGEGYAVVVSEDGTADTSGLERLLWLQNDHDACVDPTYAPPSRIARLTELRVALERRAVALGIAA